MMFFLVACVSQYFAEDDYAVEVSVGMVWLTVSLVQVAPIHARTLSGSARMPLAGLLRA